MPGAETLALFDLAREIGIGFYLGYAELTVEAGVSRRYNTSILVDKSGVIVSRYRRFICPAMPNPSRGASFSIWKSAISNPAAVLMWPTPSVA